MPVNFPSASSLIPRTAYTASPWTDESTGKQWLFSTTKLRWSIFTPEVDLSGYLSLVGGMMEAGASIAFSNGSFISVGTTDHETGGLSGLSLTCSVGYELNWQAGVLTAYEPDGETQRALIIGSDIRFAGSGITMLDSSGDTFLNPDARQLLNAAGDIILDWSGSLGTFATVNGLMGYSEDLVAYANATDAAARRVLIGSEHLTLVGGNPNRTSAIVNGTISDYAGDSVTTPVELVAIVSENAAESFALAPNSHLYYNAGTSEWLLCVGASATNGFYSSADIGTPVEDIVWVPQGAADGTPTITFSTLTATHLGQWCRVHTATADVYDWWQWNGRAWVFVRTDGASTTAADSVLAALATLNPTQILTLRTILANASVALNPLP